MSELPNGWASAAIGDLVEAGPKNECADSTEIGFVPMQRMGTRFRESPTFEVRRWSAVKKGYTPFADGDVLLARITPCFENGKGGIPRGLPNGLGAGSTEFVVLRPKPHALVPEYLLALLKTDEFLSDGKAAMTGAVGQQRVPRWQVLEYSINVPPYAEQLRIADKLDAVLARVDACRERLDRVPALLKKFREAVLEAAVSGRLTEAWRAAAHIRTSGEALAKTLNERHKRSIPRGAKSVEAPTVDEIRDVPNSWGWIAGAAAVDPSADIVYGIVQPGPKLSEGVPYVRGMDIENGRIVVGQLMRTSPAIAARYERASLKGGDVLLGIIRATKVAIVPDELTGANITQGTARFRPRPEIQTKYLARVLEAPETQKWLHDHYRGIDMPGLNLADIRRVPIPVPSVEEQAEIVRLVDELSALADSLEAKYRTAVKRMEKLTPAVLAKAFRGELVPQDPGDEPAEKLLERIRQTREDETALPVVRGRRKRVVPRTGTKAQVRRRSRAS